MRQLIADADRFVRDHRRLVVWIAVAVALSYGFDVANFSLSIDEEAQIRFDHSRVWIHQGRFVTTWLKLLLGSTFPLAYFQPAAAILILAASTLIWCFVFVRVTEGKLDRSPWLTVFAVTYATMPTNAYYLSFNTYNLELSCGLALSALSVLFSFEWIDRRATVVIRRCGGVRSPRNRHVSVILAVLRGRSCHRLSSFASRRARRIPTSLSRRASRLACVWAHPSPSATRRFG